MGRCFCPHVGPGQKVAPLALLSLSVCSGFFVLAPHRLDSDSYQRFPLLILLLSPALPFFFLFHFPQNPRIQRKLSASSHIILNVFSCDTDPYFKLSSSHRCFSNLAVRMLFQISHLNSFQCNKVNCFWLLSLQLLTISL